MSTANSSVGTCLFVNILKPEKASNAATNAVTSARKLNNILREGILIVRRAISGTCFCANA